MPIIIIPRSVKLVLNHGPAEVSCFGRLAFDVSLFWGHLTSLVASVDTRTFPCHTRCRTV